MTAVERRMRLGPRCGGREDRHRRRGDEIGPVMFAQPIEIEPDLVGELDLLEQVVEPLRRRLQMAAVKRVRGVLGERIETDFHCGAPSVAA